MMPVVYNINLICYNHYISTDPAFQENSYSHHIDHEIGVVPWRAHGMLVVCMFYMPYVYTCSDIYIYAIYIHTYVRIQDVHDILVAFHPFSLHCFCGLKGDIRVLLGFSSHHRWTTVLLIRLPVVREVEDTFYSSQMQWSGLRQNLQEPPMFDGENSGFWLRLSPNLLTDA